MSGRPQVLLFLALLAAVPAFADTHFWTGGGANNNWSAANNWSGGAPASGDALIFAGTTRLTPNNDLSGYTFANIVFSNNSGAFTLGGNSFTLAAGGEIRNDSAATQALSLAFSSASTASINTAVGDITAGGVISGACVLRKSGSGKLTLSGNNLYSVGTVIAGGTLSVSKDNQTTHQLGALSAGCTLTLAGGALEVTGGALFGSGQNWLLRNVVLGSGGGAVLSSVELGHEAYAKDPPYNLASFISGGTAANGLTLKGGDIVIRPGAQNTLGKLTVFSGRAFLRMMDTSVSYPVAPSDAIEVNAGAVLAFTDSMPRSITNRITFASGSVLSSRLPNSVGAMTLSTANVQFPSEGVMYFNHDDMSTDTITINGAYPVLSGDLIIQVGGNNTSVGAVTFNGGFSGDHALYKFSTGTLVLNAASTHSGGTTVNGGTLDVRKDGALGSGPVAVAGGATLKLGSGTRHNYIADNATLLLADTAAANLAFTGTDTVAALSFDSGATFQALGTWGSATSAADHKNARFTGSGILNVVLPTTTTVDASANPSIYGTPPHFTATVSASDGTPAGTVQFLTNGVAFGSAVALAGGTADSAPLPAATGAGTLAVTAVYAPAGTFGASSGTLTQAINPLPVVLTGSRAYDGTAAAAAAILSVGNRVGSDAVTVASGSATLAGALAGAQALVSTGTLALGGAAAPNYTLSGASGTVTILPGAAALLRLESAADGSGAPVNSPTVRAGSALLLYAVARDAGTNFVANTNATWALTNASGGVTAGDLVAAPDGRSATFTGHAVGAARVSAAAGCGTGLSGYLVVPLEPGAIHLPPFEGATIATAQPAWPNQDYFVKDASLNQYACWTIDAGSGMGGTDAALALPGPNANGLGGTVQDLRVYFFPVVSNACYTLGFHYRAIGPGFNGHQDASASEMQILVLESPNISGGDWLPWSGPTLRLPAAAWTNYVHAFTTQPTTRSVCLKFGAVFAVANRTNATDRFYLDDDASPAGQLAPALRRMRMEGNGCVLEWTGTNAWYFTVETATSLVPVAVWTTNLVSAANLPGSNGWMSGTDTNPAPQRFYRLRLTR